MKIEKLFITTKCPYCKHENRYVIHTDDYNTTIIIWCKANFGGCGKAFVVSIPFEITVPGQAYKIDDHNELKMPLP